MDDFYATRTPRQLRDIAAMHQGMCDDGDLDAADLNWRLVPNLDLAVVIGCIGRGERKPVIETLEQSWARWFRIECDEIARELDGVREWDVLATEEILEPIVVTIEPDRVQIWDGWHRTGGSITAGRGTIPAIVGTLADVASDADPMILSAPFRSLSMRSRPHRR